MAVFPSGLLPKITHGVLSLPGPGSGVAVIGPLIALVALLNYLLVRKQGTMLLCCVVLGTLHSIFMQEVFPSARTVGTVGPLPLRILAVILLGMALELTTWLLALRTPWLRYLASAACASLVFLLFYWIVVYPFTNKPPVKLHSGLILGGTTIIAGALVGGCLPALLDRARHRQA